MWRYPTQDLHEGRSLQDMESTWFIGEYVLDEIVGMSDCNSWCNDTADMKHTLTPQNDYTVDSGPLFQSKCPWLL